MKVVLDTNVFVSGIFWKGPPFQILSAWQQDKLTLVVSPEILAEYARVSEALSRSYPGVAFRDFVDLAAIYSEVCQPHALPEPVCKDPDDDKFIAAALEIKACVVTGDKLLLAVSGYQGIEIMNARRFLSTYLR